MITKTDLKKQIESLPEEFSIDELVDRLILIEKIEKAEKESQEDKVFTEDRLMQDINNWFK